MADYPMNTLLGLSQQMLVKAKMQQWVEVKQLVLQLKQTDINLIKNRFATDTAIKTFWINLYNGFSLWLLHESEVNLDNLYARIVHFRSNKINIGGKIMSLDDIEHGILRRSKIWWAKGYFSKPLVSNFEKQFRVKSIDIRIHFALNCGDESCPPIRFYELDKLDDQLELAKISFLESETSFDLEKNTVQVSKILDWYRGDFGGNKGIIKLLKELKLIPEGKNPKVIFK